MSNLKALNFTCGVNHNCIITLFFSLTWKFTIHENSAIDWT